MRVRIWGARGSVSTPSPDMLRYGANTPCVEVRADDGTLFILDCGTGMARLGDVLVKEGPVSAHILLSHTHWDHIQGFPFFAPASVPDNRLVLYCARNLDKRLEDVMAGQMEYTYFAITLSDLPAEILYRELLEETFTVGKARITTHYLNHPSICLGYRIETDRASIAYITDHEPYGLALFGHDPPAERLGRGLRDGVVHVGDRRLIEFLKGVDLAILDCRFTDVEYPQKIGHGHGSVAYAVDVALMAGVRGLALFHHDPTRTDDDMDLLVAMARKRVAESGGQIEVFGAFEGAELVVGGRDGWGSIEDGQFVPRLPTGPAASTWSAPREKPVRLPRLRVFLCHSSQDKPAVRALYGRLRDEPDIDPWLDEENLLPGQDWQLEIPKAVRASDLVIVCLSQGSISRAGYLQKEIRYALDTADEQPEGAIFLIPLRLEECDVPKRLRVWHWLDYFEERGYERLLRALRARSSGSGPSSV